MPFALRRTVSRMARTGAGTLCSMWMAVVVVILPLIAPDLFPSSSWQTAIFSEWEPPTSRHAALLDSLDKTRLLEAEPEGLWDKPDNGGWEPCAHQQHNEPSLPTGTNGYLQVFLEGGLNQQRMGICDAVAVAKILNATLVLPQFDVNPVWQDSRHI